MVQELLKIEQFCHLKIEQFFHLKIQLNKNQNYFFLKGNWLCALGIVAKLSMR
jgi:hypothetical protein